MRTQRWSVGLIVLATLVGWGGYAQADTAVTVDISSQLPDFNISKYPQDQVSLGWRFFVDKSITITHVGLLDPEGDGLTSTHTIALWRLPNKGGFGAGPLFTVNVGPGAVSGGDNHVYVALNPPITLDPNTIGYTLSNGTVNYERWLLGVWSPSGNQDKLVVYPLGAVTANGTDCWHIQEINGLKSYTYRTYDLNWYNTKAPYSTPSIVWPWGGTESFKHWAMNFKYTMPGPLAEAGDPCDIYTSEQALTVIAGTATHTLPGTAMQYEWFEGTTSLGSGTVTNGAAPLNLGLVAALSTGPHTLRLEVTDGVYTSTDEMQLTVANTPPEGQPTPTYQVLEIGTDAVLIAASVADFDGDTVSYQWIKDGVVLESGTITPPAGGAPVDLIDDLTFPAGDPLFTLGANQVQFAVSDGVNPAVTETVTVVMQDTTFPTLAPTPSICMLWPPNHQLIPVTIWANAEDNGGGSVVLAASVQCSENDGDGELDSYVDSVDNAAGTISLRLRAERAGSGDGRVYTVTVTATDGSNNQSVATVDIRVPHDKRKK